MAAFPVDSKNLPNGLSFLAVEVAGDVHRLFVTYSAIQHVVPIKKDNTALIENASIAIMQTIDGSVELIVTSKGLENQLTILQM